MAYSTTQLLDQLLEFKERYGQYPTRQDFTQKRISLSKNTFLRKFGSMEKAIEKAELYEKGDFNPEDGKEARRQEIHVPKLRKGGFPCPFCGNNTSNANRYYSSLKQILMTRFTNLLKQHNDPGYLNGVFAAIHAVFGSEEILMREALRSAGFLESFEGKYGDGLKPINQDEKDICQAA